jgi:hypothetical protein
MFSMLKHALSRFFFQVCFQDLWNSLSGFRPMRSYEEVVAVASLVTAAGITSRSALLEMAEAEDRPDAASFGQLSRHDEQALLLRAR